MLDPTPWCQIMVAKQKNVWCMLCFPHFCMFCLSFLACFFKRRLFFLPCQGSPPTPKLEHCHDSRFFWFVSKPLKNKQPFHPSLSNKRRKIRKGEKQTVGEKVGERGRGEGTSSLFFQRMWFRSAQPKTCFRSHSPTHLYQLRGHIKYINFHITCNCYSHLHTSASCTLTYIGCITYTTQQHLYLPLHH